MCASSSSVEIFIGVVVAVEGHIMKPYTVEKMQQ